MTYLRDIGVVLEFERTPTSKLWWCFSALLSVYFIQYSDKVQMEACYSQRRRKSLVVRAKWMRSIGERWLKIYIVGLKISAIYRQRHDALRKEYPSSGMVASIVWPLTESSSLQNFRFASNASSPSWVYRFQSQPCVSSRVLVDRRSRCGSWASCSM